MNRLRASLFSSVLKQEVAFFDKTCTGELINRLSADAALLGRSVTENLSDGLRAGAQASVGIGMMVRPSASVSVRAPWQGEPHSRELCSALCRGLGDPGQLPYCWHLNLHFLSGDQSVAFTKALLLGF